MKKILFIAWFLVLFASTGNAQELFRALTETLHSGAAANATGKILKVEGWASVGLQVNGIVTATITFQVSQDAALGWENITCTKSSDGTSVSSLTADGAVSCPVSGYKYFKAPISGYSAGTITVKALQTTAASRSGSGGGSSTASAIAGSDTLPAEPCTVNQVYGETTAGVSIFYFCQDGTWVSVNTGGTPGLQQAADIGRVVGNATSSGTSVDIGSTADDEFTSILRDATLGPRVTCKISGVLDACSKGFMIKPGFKFVIQDESLNIMTNWEPNAATSNEQYALGAKKAKVSFMLPLNPRGAATGAYESIVTNQPSDYYLTVTDANTDAADFSFMVTNRMAGATTATFRLVGVSKHATPSGNIDFDCALSTFTPGTDTYTAHVKTGEVTALLTPATQSRPVAVTTASHTINGGPLVAGDIVKGSCEVDATATTSAQLTDFRLEGWVLVTLDVNSFSD